MPFGGLADSAGSDDHQTLALDHETLADGSTQAGATLASDHSGMLKRATAKQRIQGPDNTAITCDTETQDDRRAHLSHARALHWAAAPSFREPLGSSGSLHC